MGGSGIPNYIPEKKNPLCSKFALKFMQNTKIWKNRVYLIPIKGPIAASKYCVLDLKSPYILYTQKP